jgi:signal recognition particle receptor subunit beta
LSITNYQAREINCKIVYVGPPMSGKSTNLSNLFNRVNPESKGKMISLETETDKTIFFDFLPGLPDVRGFKIRVHLYTVKSETVYGNSLLKALKGADGVVLVADSDPARQSANEEALTDLANMLKETGADIARMPRVIQYNKRDVAGAPSIGDLRGALNGAGVAEFEAVATTGQGVVETMKSIVKLVYARINL